MITGLYDADMIALRNVPFNLEIMKYATYFQKRREIVKLVRKIEPNRYTNFIYRKDYDDGYFPTDLLLTDNVTYGGRAFNPNVYVPLDEDIEKLIPNKEIYAQYRARYSNYNSELEDQYSNMLHAQHGRLSLDGKTIWDKAESQFNIEPNTHLILLHDYNLNTIEGADEYIADLLSRATCKRETVFGVKYPIQVYSIKDLIRWCRLPNSPSYFMIEYMAPLDLSCLSQLHELDVDNVKYQYVRYCIGAQYESETDFTKDLANIWKTAMFIRQSQMKVRLSVPPKFFSNPIYDEIINLINIYICSIIKYKYKISMSEFVSYLLKHGVNQVDKPLYTRIFQFVKINHPDLYDLFYKCRLVKLEGGILYDDTSRN